MSPTFNTQTIAHKLRTVTYGYDHPTETHDGLGWFAQIVTVPSTEELTELLALILSDREVPKGLGDPSVKMVCGRDADELLSNVRAIAPEFVDQISATIDQIPTKALA